MLDNKIAELIKNYQTQQHPSYTSFSPVKLRKWFNDLVLSKSKPTPIPIASTEKINIPGPGGDLTIRIYTPNGPGPHPALMYFHGGGFVIRDNMDIYDQTCRRMCAGASCVVIAVDFRLAPENPFPAAPEDCYFATCWVAKNAEKLNIDLNHFGVWGESCGGNLATVVSMLARDRKGPELACQIIVTAMLDTNFNTESYKQNGNGEYILTTDTMRWFWDKYISNKNHKKNSYSTPCTSSNLANLPPALVITVDYDPLRDEGLNYAEQLKQAGVSTEVINYPGLIHGLFDHIEISPQAKKACDEIICKTNVLLS